MEKCFFLRNWSSCFEFLSPNPQLKANGNGIATRSQPENGCSELDPPLPPPEKALKKLVQQPAQQGPDEHLIDFAESITTVAKALREVADGKASAQAEASEWKRKYELERAKNLGQDHNNELSTKEAQGEIQCESSLANGEAVVCKSSLANGARKPMKKASFKLAWNGKGKNTNQYKHDVVSFARGDIVTTGCSSKQISLKWETSPQTILVLTKPNSDPVQVLCAEMIRWLTETKKLSIFVEPRVKSELLAESAYFEFVQTWQDEEQISLLHKEVDLLVTLGGDGTVLWAASLFKGPIPPIVPFSMGSLGFMTTFYRETYKESLDSIFRGPVSITLRHRLQCHVVRYKGEDYSEPEDQMLVLNEVTIDRGISSFLTNLECFCDGSFVTRVQGDGLILSTTSGSTAYSLAAGGSMVHPQVPGILFTPISPHSLSFRPLILPEYVTLKVQVPLDSRSPAWASFDGKDRKKLGPGDALMCSMAPWPLPTACRVDSVNDFLRSIHDGLHWNLRKTQNSEGPKDT